MFLLELFESNIPYSGYGYWVTADGEFISVSDEHLKAARKLGMDTEEAINNGWIRVVHKDNDWIVAQYEPEAVTVDALQALIILIRAGRYEGDEFAIDYLWGDAKTFNSVRAMLSFLNNEMKQRRTAAAS